MPRQINVGALCAKLNFDRYPVNARQLRNIPGRKPFWISLTRKEGVGERGLKREDETFDHHVNARTAFGERREEGGVTARKIIPLPHLA